MVIPVYQVNNVLRVYGEQLRQNRGLDKPSADNNRQPDKISISSEARRKTIVDKISSQIVGRITKYGPNDDVEKEIFKKLEDQYGARLEIAGEGSSDLIFKVIDDDGETVNSLSIEDSKFLHYNLKTITKELIDKNMI
ncbi:MAG: hypothetical protein JXA79_04730 [Deltaproteobacteria bacterium]|nr:hypothetical protein [Deltaproteobacteria bacterium]